MGRIASVLVLMLALPLVCQGQSLGSVAKKERERREKNKEQGVAVRQVREDEVSTAEDEKPQETALESDAAEDEGGAETDTPEVEPSPERIDVKLGVEEPKSIEEQEDDRSLKESEWRARFQDARARVAAAREQVKVLEELYLSQGEYYVDAEGRTVIGGVDDLQRLNREAKMELEAAEKSLKDLQEEARRAGVPPGWLR